VRLALSEISTVKASFAEDVSAYAAAGFDGIGIWEFKLPPDDEANLALLREHGLELGLEPRGKGQVEGRWVDRIVALDEVRVEFAMLRTPDGHGEIELVKFHSPPTQTGDPHAPANTPGLRHLAFLVEDIDAVVADLRARGTELVGELVRYEDSYRLCYVRGPEGIIIELAEKIG